jgi:hypothetical protein
MMGQRALPGQALSRACRDGSGFASRKLKHSPAAMSERKKRLPWVALSRITIPCSDVRLITTSPNHGSLRTRVVSTASWTVDEVEALDVSGDSVGADVVATCDDSLAEQLTGSRLATKTSGKMDLRFA